MYQDAKDKFHSISTFVKDTEKYVEDVKLNKDKYNYWIKTIMENNMSSSISFSGRDFSISGGTSIKVAPLKVSPLLLAIYSKREKAMKQEKVSKKKNLMDEAWEGKDKTICNMQGEICIFFNNPKDVNPDETKDVNISGEMTFRSIVVKDHLKITFNIKNVVVESVYEKKYRDLDSNVFSTN